MRAAALYTVVGYGLIGVFSAIASGLAGNGTPASTARTTMTTAPAARRQPRARRVRRALRRRVPGHPPHVRLRGSCTRSPFSMPGLPEISPIRLPVHYAVCGDRAELVHDPGRHGRRHEDEPRRLLGRWAQLRRRRLQSGRGGARHAGPPRWSRCSSRAASAAFAFASGLARRPKPRGCTNGATSTRTAEHEHGRSGMFASIRTGSAETETDGRSLSTRSGEGRLSRPTWRRERVPRVLLAARIRCTIEN